MDLTDPSCYQLITQIPDTGRTVSDESRVQWAGCWRRFNVCYDSIVWVVIGAHVVCQTSCQHTDCLTGSRITCWLLRLNRHCTHIFENSPLRPVNSCALSLADSFPPLRFAHVPGSRLESDEGMSPTRAKTALQGLMAKILLLSSIRYSEELKT